MGNKSIKSKRNSDEQQAAPTPEAAATAPEAANDQENQPRPPPSHIDPQSKLRVRSPDRPIPKFDGEPIQKVEGLEQEDQEALEADNERDLVAGEERLVRVPNALVHLIDKQESVKLASGTFSLVRLTQNGNEVAVFARVGKDLQWPILKDEVVTKLDAGHYFFTIRVDPDDGDDDQSRGEEGSNKQSFQTLSYGVTFKVKGNESRLTKLDETLERYSFFSKPKMMQGDEEKLKEQLETDGMVTKPEEIEGQVVPAATAVAGQDLNKKPSEEKSRLYWTAIAPNVEDYNSSIAKGVATGTGHVIRSIFWCSNSTVAQLEKGGAFIKRHTKAGKKDSTMSPMAMRNIKRVRRLTRMSDRVAKGILTGVVTATGYFTTAAVTSKVGKKFFKMMPGEVALASLEAFGKVFDAVEMAGQNILSGGTMVTTQVVAHKFGDEAGEFTHEGLASVGHVLSTAWAISKLRKAFNPKQTKPSTRTMLKTAAKNAITRQK